MVLPKFQKDYEISSSVNKTDNRFVTDSGIVYVIYTLPGSNFIPGFIFSRDMLYLGFRPLYDYSIPINTTIKNSYDDKIMNTIFNFIIDIFEYKNAILAFNYSAESGKQVMRNKLFNIFYLRHNKNKFHKMDFNLPRVGACSIIFRKDNDNFASICTITDADIIKNIQNNQRR